MQASGASEADVTRSDADAVDHFATALGGQVERFIDQAPAPVMPDARNGEEGHVGDPHRRGPAARGGGRSIPHRYGVGAGTAANVRRRSWRVTPTW